MRWVRSFVNEEHPAWEGFDFDKAVGREGIWGRPDGIYDSQIVFADGVFPPPSTKFTFYNDDLVEFEEEVPCYKPMLEDPKGPLGEVPARVSAVPRPHERAHPAHRYSGAGGHPGRASAGDEPGGCQSSRIADGDVVSITNDRGACKMKVLSPRGIVPGTVATKAAGLPTTPSRATTRCSPT